ncbi:restriction endonuclease subunit S [Enterococcus faecalis]|uniref:restriction endonuclease subunit S n=1 Tax=Enterococcus TaxID=1350 RepID=UPI000DE9974F|nr:MULTISPECIES: restriction endonuclease subunit S [Enterococcus]EGO2849138.1 restriction endonuclease subunit S [Enterococcus faecalis]EGO6133996.1 restriction endonuclease subunit S [Enterococcus faecalis]EIV0114342.1 restriction endonuclease subunit S [Enterococcus faecalis]EIW4235042.1 restriction endonuclease subunit S [Enterococcus faecalis]EJC3735206.1 restriction endonuclease subunit S [Enterococcus faecalis]
MKYKKVKLKDIIFFNPKETIKKNQLAKKIPMDALIPFTRKVGYYEVKEFNSGTKFRNNDTLMARITPCLENGKTAYVNILNEDEIAFGSTEYFVLRADENYILPKYLYYISISDKLRNVAIKSMTGTSGRQRAQKESILDFEIELPSISIQKKVLSILDSIDSKIELNNQIISNLEELASTLFKRWFVDFEFPDENGNPYKSSGGKMVDSELGEIPEGWEITELKSIVDVVDNRGKTPPLEKDKTDFPIIDVKTLSGNGRVVNYNKAQKYVSEETYSSWFRSGHPKINDILISTVGSIGEIKMFLTDKGTIAQNVVGLRAKKHLEYHLYQFLLYNKSNLITYNIGSVQPSIKVTHLLKHKVLLPNKKDLNKFNSVMIGLTDKIINLSKEINSLTEIRDSLLPKLLSGEVELPEDEEV